MEWDDARARAALRGIFDAAVAAADPLKVLARHLPDKPPGRVVVVGAGKSAAVMAQAVERAWPDTDLSGLVVTRYGHAVPTQRIKVMQSSHPVPDANSEAASRFILHAVQGLTADDLVLALISGGGSALMALPAPGLALADKQAINKALLASGATIHEMNTVRKHLSGIKGGRLAAAAAPARVVTLAISDVPGDDPAVIASGPTVPDPTTFADARALLARYGITPSPAIAARLAQDADETPKPGSLPHAEFRMIATPAMALQATAAAARSHGLTPLILGDALEGESREMGTVMAGIARSIRGHGLPLPAPAVLLSGGETTVTIGQGPAGRGGRNTEFLLGLALALAATPNVWAIAGDTDGIDGTEDTAGAIVAPDTLARARAAGLDPRAVLAAHDSYGLFDAVGDLVRTGPTLTNVNDIRAILVA
ncbi:glycerate kinase type-2 family protein [Limobrevibacterium gyesilva]|uniref:Glycerate kinase n=1 Tax=Limobrevibacterium gyesilva TaxID=2991712 RepID=A0AA41YRQ1_9PROT|nr:glycerate kinase [Limobrevibacterium gyesilva]MCW3477337.1 glycerate kinase [Limobrevibacterium gyesilva]